MNELKLSKEIFEKAVILNAISQYDSLCRISINEKDNNYYKLSFSNCLYSNEETIKEFENYVIDLMNSNY